MAWNGSNSAGASTPAPKKPAKKSPRLTHGLIAGAAIVLIGVISLYFVTSEPDEPTDDAARKDHGRIEEVSPSISVTESMTNSVPDPIVKDEKLKVPVGNVITARSYNVGRVMTLMDGTVVTNGSRRIFKRDFENTLLVVLRPGSMSLPLFRTMRTRYTDEQIVQMLKELTIPQEGDDELTARCKNRVQKLKEDMLSQILDGKSVKEVLDSIQSELAHENAMRYDLRKTVREAIKSGDPETAADTVYAVNKLLEMKGQPKLDGVPVLHDREKGVDDSTDNIDALSEQEGQ